MALFLLDSRLRGNDKEGVFFWMPDRVGHDEEVRVAIGAETSQHDGFS